MQNVEQVVYIYIFSMAQQPPVDQNLLIVIRFMITLRHTTCSRSPLEV